MINIPTLFSQEGEKEKLKSRVVSVESIYVNKNANDTCTRKNFGHTKKVVLMNKYIGDQQRK